MKIQWQSERDDRLSRHLRGKSPSSPVSRASQGVLVTLGMPRALYALAALFLALFTTAAQAHTISYGYVAGTQPGTYTFWYGSYHTTTNFTEGSLKLTCGGGFSSTVSFGTQNNLVYSLPSGLVQRAMRCNITA